MKQAITEANVTWVERLVDEFEEVLQLPPGFVAFGQMEAASHLDVARTGVRKAERLVVKMNSEELVTNNNILRYLNRLSDLIFLLACFEEKDADQQKQIQRKLLRAKWRDPVFKRFAIIGGIAIFLMVVLITLLLLFHGKNSQTASPDSKQHMQQMGSIHPEMIEPGMESRKGSQP